MLKLRGLVLPFDDGELPSSAVATRAEEEEEEAEEEDLAAAAAVAISLGYIVGLVEKIIASRAFSFT